MPFAGVRGKCVSKLRLIFEARRESTATICECQEAERCNPSIGHANSARLGMSPVD
jgi:hypothetical protein